MSSGTAALHLSRLSPTSVPGRGDRPRLDLRGQCERGALRWRDRCSPTSTRARGSSIHAVRELITTRTKAIVGVDYAGSPCDWPALRELADAHGLVLIEDAAHAPGASIDGRQVGSFADFTCFSFHPVKHLTTAEGGMVTTTTVERAARLRSLRGHGIANDFRARESAGTWEYDQRELGFNYRLPDTACALRLSQLHKQPEWLRRRRRIAERYDSAFAGMPEVQTQVVPDGRVSAWHLYPVRITSPDAADLPGCSPRCGRRGSASTCTTGRCTSTVLPRPRLPRRLCPQAEAIYSGLLSLPMWPGLTEAQQDRVVSTLSEALEADTWESRRPDSRARRQHPSPTQERSGLPGRPAISRVIDVVTASVWWTRSSSRLTTRRSRIRREPRGARPVRTPCRGTRGRPHGCSPGDPARHR